MRNTFFSLLLAGLGGLACGNGGADDGADAGPTPASTAHCSYAPRPATARAGGTVTAGAISAGVAEAPLGLPVSAALGGNTSRAVAIENQGAVDSRRTPLSGGFTPSIGIETIPRIKALALTAGDETVVLLSTDSIFGDDSITVALEERLGAELGGKVLWTSTHTHTAVAQYSADLKLQAGGGRVREEVRARLLDVLESTARAALAARAPAKLGIAARRGFDPTHKVSYDRRPENDGLFGGAEAKDDYLAVIRVDRADGTPLAILPIFGVHSAILDDDVSLLSTDVSGMYERLVEEEFDAPVTVMHLQGAAGDVLASSDRHIAVADDEPDMDFARSEENGRRALPAIMEVWAEAGAAMRTEVELEMLTRSVELGPDWRKLTTRAGALAYAPFDGVRVPDGAIFAGDGAILSPIDEFNAPFGAGLCGDPTDDRFQSMRMPGAEGLGPYHSCATLPGVITVLAALIDAEFGDAPICASTRTTVSALRIGDWLIAAAPGEPLVLWAARVRERSPVPADKTIVLGYAQGHIGYLLVVEDWLLGGFEPSINLWGPLEGEVIADALVETMGLAVTPAREDGAATGATRVVPPAIVDGLPELDPAPMAGMAPAIVPPSVYFVSLPPPAGGQPADTVPRVAGVAQFVWIGEDPRSGTPRVTLERELDGMSGVFEPVRRRSGRPVEELDFLLLWTPDPLSGSGPRTHYWAVQWQAVQVFGAAGEASLGERAGLPLGHYRFAVEGTGYALTSDAFEVIPGVLLVGVEQPSGGDLLLTVELEALQGFRLLGLDGLSNRRRAIALEQGPVRVEIERASGPIEVHEGLSVEPAGKVFVDAAPPGAPAITKVRVFDRYGNLGETLTP